MSPNEVVRRLIHAAGKTQRIRVYSGEDRFTSSSTLPDELIDEIDDIIQFLNDELNKSTLCSPNEYLLIYNFQSISIGGTHQYELSVLAKSMDQLTETNNLKLGRRLDLIVDAERGELINSTKSLLRIEKANSFETIEGMDPSINYGNYRKAFTSLFNKDGGRSAKRKSHEYRKSRSPGVN